MYFKRPRFSGWLIALTAIALQACVFASKEPLLDQDKTLEFLPKSFIATEVWEPEGSANSQQNLPVYDGRYADGKYRLVRRGDGAVVDIWFAGIGNGDLLMMMAWRIDEETPFMYLTARHEAPYLVFDDPSYLAENIETYRQEFGADIALVRDGTKFNDSLKITSLTAVKNAIRFYREHNDRNGKTIRYRIDPAK